MGVLFQPSAPTKPDEEQHSDYEQNNLDGSSKTEVSDPWAEPLKDLEYRNVELQQDFESISLPPGEQKVEAANDGNVTEFYPQFIGILPGENSF